MVVWMNSVFSYESLKCLITNILCILIRVTKEVDSSSKEAKEFVKQKEKGQEEQEKTPEPARTGVAAGSR